MLCLLQEVVSPFHCTRKLCTEVLDTQRPPIYFSSFVPCRSELAIFSSDMQVNR
ncbi:hypothetical protein TRIUR3_10199 [Triticum urartu]|uniref:Uncharacterized protein n=1 Tax=Triticum urartu TaxID=4572 RepID=M8AGH7_TRIUA|nr:hypothetical protein TRIUR3_22009 [Triticum urartu]EMS63977.1 hypothetical protein TRIUR3_10196 [Triticum urartu]EMS63980.1 hypothetical protein TRIUR3_10199 [Triticum urartu]